MCYTYLNMGPFCVCVLCVCWFRILGVHNMTNASSFHPEIPFFLRGGGLTNLCQDRCTHFFWRRELRICHAIYAYYKHATTYKTHKDTCWCCFVAQIYQVTHLLYLREKGNSVLSLILPILKNRFKTRKILPRTFIFN